MMPIAMLSGRKILEGTSDSREPSSRKEQHVLLVSPFYFYLPDQRCSSYLYYREFNCLSKSSHLFISKSLLIEVKNKWSLRPENRPNGKGFWEKEY